MKLKVCGMKYTDNIQEVASLRPDYLGFIFYQKSSRFFEETIPPISNTIKKVGVFVDAPESYVLSMTTKHDIHMVQLHGNESPDFCKNLKQQELEVIKVFSIRDEFDFSVLRNFEDVCDYFLFDTKGKLPGGNGHVFNWDVLNDYPSRKPYFLSGGIGLDETTNLHAFLKSPASKYCWAIDVNSKFEIEAGLKNITSLKDLKTQI